MRDAAFAFWLCRPGMGEIRGVPLPEPALGDVVVRTIRAGISRGTETLVFRGGVPPTRYAAMRAPFQDGDFPGPVKEVRQVGDVVLMRYALSQRFSVEVPGTATVGDDGPPTLDRSSSVTLPVANPSPV